MALPNGVLFGQFLAKLESSACAQASRAISWKSFLFNLKFENKRVRRIFGGGTMYGNVAPHAWSHPNFPHSETAPISSRLSRRHKSVIATLSDLMRMFLRRSVQPLRSGVQRCSNP